MRRLPIIPTILVLAAIAVMLRLGFWQLERRDEKTALLQSYAAADRSAAEVPWPVDGKSADGVLYRRSRVACAKVMQYAAMAGESARGEAGLAHTVTCALAGGGTARVVLGWARDPAPRNWQGGAVAGTIAPGPRLVADPPQAGLAANAVPDPSGIPNNHLSYAVQWFLFAGVALVIYALALRKRLAGGANPR